MTHETLTAPLVGIELATRMRTFRASLSKEAGALLDELLAGAAQHHENKGGSKAAGTFFLSFTFKLVAVKTISWAHDD